MLCGAYYSILGKFIRDTKKIGICNHPCNSVSDYDAGRILCFGVGGFLVLKFPSPDPRKASTMIRIGSVMNPVYLGKLFWGYSWCGAENGTLVVARSVQSSCIFK